MPWYRGNLHCHTTNSDGDSNPAEVAKIYKDAGFNFLCITDHNHLTLAPEYGPQDPSFLAIPSSEYTGLTERFAHVNGLGLSKPFAPTEIKGVLQTLQEGVDQAVAQGAVAMLNHPNWEWCYGAKEMAAIRGAQLFELYNGAHNSSNDGTPSRPSTEAMWDELLSQGIRLWGAGSDDCHSQKAPFSPFKDPPFSAWTVVQAKELSQDAILTALRQGQFYASTRIELNSLKADREGLHLEIDAWNQMDYYTRFIGRGGKLLAEVEGPAPSYRFKGDEGYVRANIFCSDKHRAWTQPVFLETLS
jgi:hypothetical protein